MTSPLDVDPNLSLNYTSYTTTLTFQDGDVGYIDTGMPQPDCSSKNHWDPFGVPNVKKLQYTLYRRFLTWRSTREEEMLTAIEEMLTDTKIVSLVGTACSVWLAT